MVYALYLVELYIHLNVCSLGKKQDICKITFV